MWLAKHANELDYLIVVKGYSVYQARLVVSKMIRPICQWCRKPISGGKNGAMFHKRDSCHVAHDRFKKLVKSGLTPSEALAIIRRERP